MPSPSTSVRNALAYAVPELFWGITWALTVDGSMLAAFSNDFGGSQGFVGLAWLLASFGLGVPLLLSAFWVEPLRHKRAFVFWGHVAGGLAMLVVAMLVHLSGDAAMARVAYLAGTTLFFVSVGLLLPGWFALVGELFSPATQARVLGVTFFANKLAAVFAGHVVAEQVLANSWTPSDQWTFLFALAGVAGVVGSLPFLWIVETPRPRPHRGTWRAYARSLRDALRERPALRRFITADAVGMTTLLVFTFYADAAFRSGEFESARAGRWVMVGAMAQMAASGLIAWRGERVRPRAWLVLGVCAAAGAAVAAAIGGTLLAYDLTAAGVGVYMATRASCHAPEVMRLAAGRDGTAPIGIALAVVMPVQGLLPWLAGALVIPRIGYLPVFAAVAALGLLAAVLLCRWVPRDVVTDAESHPARVPAD